MVDRDGVVAEADSLMDAIEAARLLGVSRRHFLRLVSSGQAPRCLRLGRSVRWSRNALQRFIAAGCKMTVAA